MQSFLVLAIISVEFVLIGYTMAFGNDENGIIGSFSKFGLSGVGLNIMDGTNIPKLAFVV